MSIIGGAHKNNFELSLTWDISSVMKPEKDTDKSMGEGQPNIKNVIMQGLDLRQARVLERFADEIRTYYAELNIEIPDKFYHYTSYSVAESICKNHELWLYSIFDPATEENKGAGMIDQQEVIAGLKIICDELRSVFNQESMNCFGMFCDIMEKVFNERYSDFAQVHMFCISASKSRYLWENAKKRGDPAYLVFTAEMFLKLCAIEEKRHDGKSTGAIELRKVCYHEQELRKRVRPFYISARSIFKRAIEVSDGDGPFLWSIMERLSMQLTLPLLTQAYAFKDANKNMGYIEENEIRLLKIFPHGFKAIGQDTYDGRRRVIQEIDPDLPIEVITDQGE